MDSVRIIMGLWSIVFFCWISCLTSRHDRTCPAACGCFLIMSPEDSTWSCSSSVLWPTLDRLVLQTVQDQDSKCWSVDCHTVVLTRFFCLTRVFSPLLCLGWISISLFCLLRNGKDHLYHETLSHNMLCLLFVFRAVVSMPFIVFVFNAQVIQSVVWKEARRAAADRFTRRHQVDLRSVHQIPQGPVLSRHSQKEKVKAASWCCCSQTIWETFLN